MTNKQNTNGEPSRKLNALTDQDGKYSSMRLMAYFCVIVSAFIAIVIIFRENCPGHTYLVIYFLTAAFGGKSVQKHFELRKNANTDSGQ